MFLPGLTGDHTKYYCIDIVREAHKNHCDVVVANYRGQCGMRLTSKKPYDATDT